jgi:hypothetical protein
LLLRVVTTTTTTTTATTILRNVRCQWPEIVKKNIFVEGKIFLMKVLLFPHCCVLITVGSIPPEAKWVLEAFLVYKAVEVCLLFPCIPSTTHGYW